MRDQGFVDDDQFRVQVISWGSFEEPAGHGRIRVEAWTLRLNVTAFNMWLDSRDDLAIGWSQDEATRNSITLLQKQRHRIWKRAVLDALGIDEDEERYAITQICSEVFGMVCWRGLDAEGEESGFELETAGEVETELER
jgi:hypothetical protein